jgi:hypothetical protein
MKEFLKKLIIKEIENLDENVIIKEIEYRGFETNENFILYINDSRYTVIHTTFFNTLKTVSQILKKENKAIKGKSNGSKN